MDVDTHVCVTGFHAVDLDSASVNDLFIPSQVRLMNHERKKNLTPLLKRQSCDGSSDVSNTRDIVSSGYREEISKYDAQRSIVDEIRGVWIADETLSRVHV